MANYTTDQAICLRVTDFSETSQVVALLTSQHGLVPMIAKGAKRQTKLGTGAFSGPLDLLSAGQAVFIPAKAGGELSTLTAWQLLNNQTKLRTTLPALYAAMICAEITLALLHPHDPHDDVFFELLAALDLLSTPQLARATVAYAMAGLTSSGYRPQLDACLNCSRPITPEEHAVFSCRAGGILCTACRTAASSREVFTPVAGRIALALDRLPTPREIQAAPPEKPGDLAALRQALELLLAQIEAISERAIRTRSVLALVFSGDGPAAGQVIHSKK